MRTGFIIRTTARSACLALCVAALSTAGCSDRQGDGAPLGLASNKLSGTVRISGSAAMTPMISAMAADFQQQHPGVKFEIQAGASVQGLKDVKDGKSDIGMVSRPLAADERDLAPFAIARDGIAISIHGDNPVAALTNEQIADIYTRKVVNWREVGGRDAPIYLISASQRSGATDVFLNQFQIKLAAVRPDTFADANADRFAALSAHPEAILYSSLGESERRTNAGEKIKALPNAGVPATRENLAAGRYSVARPLILATRGLPSGPAQAFIDYVRSPAAIPTIERFDFVPYRD